MQGTTSSRRRQIELLRATLPPCLSQAPPLEFCSSSCARGRWRRRRGGRCPAPRSGEAPHRRYKAHRRGAFFFHAATTRGRGDGARERILRWCCERRSSTVRRERRVRWRRQCGRRVAGGGGDVDAVERERGRGEERRDRGEKRGKKRERKKERKRKLKRELKEKIKK